MNGISIFFYESAKSFTKRNFFSFIFIMNFFFRIARAERCVIIEA